MSYTLQLNAEQKFFLIEGLQQLLQRTLTGRQRREILTLIASLETIAPDISKALFANRPINYTEEGDILEA